MNLARFSARARSTMACSATPPPTVPDWPDGVTTTKVPVTPGTEPECSTTVTSVAGSPASIASSANRHGSTDWVGWAFMGPLCGRHWFEG